TTPRNPKPRPTTSPHPDTRWMAFTTSGTMLVADDGGIYQAINPRGDSGAPVWSSLNGNLRITEMYQGDLDNKGTADPKDDLLMAAAQDNGQSEGSIGTTFSQVAGGDG